MTDELTANELVLLIIKRPPAEQYDIASAIAENISSSIARTTISPEYAAELGRQIDELEAENAALQAEILQLKGGA